MKFNPATMRWEGNEEDADMQAFDDATRDDGAGATQRQHHRAGAGRVAALQSESGSQLQPGKCVCVAASSSSS